MLYESMDGTSRLRAEHSLAELATSPDCLRRCMLLLQTGTVCRVFIMRFLQQCNAKNAY
ncbi:unnamed protein product [Gongylonema pulchrum]|uniref:Uncharacterized protein n=1 Tax=Gongylonema pulchrum TaxID=637853 RepID=A0A183DUC1_9BILA|nr:unnamed protein product [Gongylonema pulchrum]